MRFSDFVFFPTMILTSRLRPYKPSWICLSLLYPSCWFWSPFVTSTCVHSFKLEQGVGDTCVSGAQLCGLCSAEPEKFLDKCQKVVAFKSAFLPWIPWLAEIFLRNNMYISCSDIVTIKWLSQWGTFKSYHINNFLWVEKSHIYP